MARSESLKKTQRKYRKTHKKTVYRIKDKSVAKHFLVEDDPTVKDIVDWNLSIDQLEKIKSLIDGAIKAQKSNKK